MLYLFYDDQEDIPAGLRGCVLQESGEVQIVLTPPPMALKMLGSMNGMNL
jgi:hypothetical protein